MTRRLAATSATFALTALLTLGLLASTACDTALQNNLVGSTQFNNEEIGGPPSANPAPLAPQSGDAAGQGEFAADDATDGGTNDVLRDIEEADVIKVVDNTMYALNPFKGLLVIDVTNPDKPEVIGQLNMGGRGVELYVVGDRAFVITSADSYLYGYYGGGAIDLPAVDEPGIAEPVVADVAVANDSIAPPEFDGSRLAVIDLSDRTNPTQQGKINLVGYANESRRVGDVIYVIGTNVNRYYNYYAPGSEQEDQGFVASINVADPADPQPIDRLNIPGDGLYLHATNTAIYAAAYSYDFNNNEEMTDVQIVDISDAGGAITLRDAFTVPGNIRNRFYMDAYDGAFRIVTESWGFGFQQVRLFTYDLSDMDDVKPLAEVQIIENESLEAVRFDGVRGYAVTFLRVDPLFVLDLADAANPKVTGELEVPGWSTHIEPRGERLIAVGIDDTDGNRPAIAYYDVSDPTLPTQLSRVILGPPGSYTSSNATYDEKAFKIIDELGLIVMPYHHYEYDFAEDDGFGFEDDFDRDDGAPPPSSDASSPNSGATTAQILLADSRCTNGVQLVDFSDDGLTRRGNFEHVGEVSRVGVIGDRVFALSDIGLQTVNIDDRDAPTMSGMAIFFSDEEMANVDECGYFYGGPEFGAPFPIDDIEFNDVGPIFFFDGDAVAALMSALQSCGGVGVLALTAMPVGVLLMRRQRWNRRTRR